MTVSTKPKNALSFTDQSTGRACVIPKASYSIVKDMHKVRLASDRNE